MGAAKWAPRDSFISRARAVLGGRSRAAGTSGAYLVSAAWSSYADFAAKYACGSTTFLQSGNFVAIDTAFCYNTTRFALFCRFTPPNCCSFSNSTDLNELAEMGSRDGFDSLSGTRNRCNGNGVAWQLYKGTVTLLVGKIGAVQGFPVFLCLGYRLAGHKRD
jgi:hypothetical protein